MKSRAISILDKEFRSKKELEVFVREALAETGKGNKIGAHLRPFFDELIKRHPEYTFKIGPGIKDFWVVPNALNPKAIALEIERIDGSRTDISWLTCVKGSAQTDKSKLMAAMRNAIAGQIQAFKRNALNNNNYCSVCGNALTEDCHVDHDPELFDDLAARFLADNTPPDSFDDHPIYNKAIFKSTDAKFELGWTEFHKREASLRLTCSICNLSKKRKSIVKRMGE